MAIDLPAPAFRWLLENAASNEELASISNVCRSWREKISDEIWKQVENSAEEDIGKRESAQHILLLPSILRCIIRDDLVDKGSSETFCLSWFHPYGIQTRRIPLNPAYDTEDEDDKMDYRGHRRIGSPNHFAPSGQTSYVGSEEEGKPGDRKGNSRMIASVGSRHNRRPKCEYVHCMYQWDSHKEATEVLRPFGFTSSFVKPLIEKASDKSRSSSSRKRKDKEKSKQSTPAVRGATIARPEGFCLCWDDSQEKLESQLRDAQNGASDKNPAELRRLVRRRARRRREVQREVLPRVVDCTPSALVYEPRSIPRAVQFLNVDFSHAVRLFTPPFSGGPIPTPITFFLVAIATEDGCFLSGLENRFEIGHLYPQNANESLVERSPICICTEFGVENKVPKATKSTDEGSQFKKVEPYNSDDSSFDVSMDGSNFDPPSKCACSFSGLGNAVEDEEDEDVGQICRGRRGPGTWHCYTIVVDGTSSVIRIDGIREPLECSNGIPAKAVAYLDGLTIGADHTFDMSLCFGQGSDGEGEGAIAELAVFKGKLNVADIMAMEKDMMHRHGIDLPELESNVILAEDVFFKRAHAMLSHPPQHKIFADGAMSVPLRYMTKHRSVAWKQANPVTGDKILVSRIGTKSTESSSDW
ncbi:unnamed protein product [Cylindrotheca closterium]|uniref:F-box domain-containing protein n=1 Tax=Cylindrotheca closterium TaxID=2856 RepID=A0AAD2CQM1_9STRA|nr:unnamed protein product [Cylindrotheca closterium]